MLIVIMILLGACIPISRLIQLRIEANPKYSDEYKHKAKVIHNIVMLVIFALMLVCWYVFRSRVF